jgi:hypothetical protein
MLEMIMIANMMWKRVVGCALLIFLITGCARAPVDTKHEITSVPLIVASITPTVVPREVHQEGLLNIISPPEDTQVSGGENLRITLYLVDHNNLPVEKAMVHAELWSPSGELFASLPCINKGEGHYLSEYVKLPLREAGGTWHVVGKATWKDGKQVETKRTIQVDRSISETYQDRHGFWIEHPHIFPLGTGFYNLAESGGLHFEDWLYEDGSGYVILDNYRYNAGGVTFVTLEIHWRHAEFPVDEATAIAHVQSLVESGLHHQEPDTYLTQLSSQMVTFQDRPTWQVVGRGQEFYVSQAAAGYPVEYIVFQCPSSEWLWSLVIATDRETYVNHLRTVRQTFECPATNSN